MPKRSKRQILLPLSVVLLGVLLFAACRNKNATNLKGEGRLTPTDSTENPTTPYILEGDYTPDTGVIYKVIVEDDTCFVIVDSIDEKEIHGHYYQVTVGSNCVERKPFTHDSHWRQERKKATVYLYQTAAYSPIKDTRYQRESFKVNVLRDIEYGQALGYWSSMKIDHTESYREIVASGLKNSLNNSIQSLTLDLYTPDNNDTLRPLLLLFHGGGFYVGDKADSTMTMLCRHFAAMGYVAASANYRLGFRPTRHDITRSVYKATQDAHAAMRFLVDNARNYGIDTNKLFVGGTSAGAITTLNLAFMTDKERPRATYAASERRDLGEIASSGNSSKSTFHIKAIVNMWGAVTNLDILKNRHTDILSFHGDADLIVPYDDNYPFNDISLHLGKRLYERMYGSHQIDQYANKIGLRSELHTFKGMGHAPQLNANGSVNRKNINIIKDKTTAFLYREIVGQEATIEEDRNDPRHYTISPDNVSGVMWDVEGGFIMQVSGNDIWVVWREEAPQRILRTSGRYTCNKGFDITKTIDNDQTGNTEQN